MGQKPYLERLAPTELPRPALPPERTTPLLPPDIKELFAKGYEVNETPKAILKH
jgi:hypothetical protein